MFKSLLLLSALIGINSMPVAQNSDALYYGLQQKQYQHTEDVGNTVVTYKYETNDVNSVDDLIDGNIYHFDFENVTIQDTSYNFNVYAIYNFVRTSSSVVYNYNLDVTSNIFNVRLFRSNYCLGVTNAFGGGLLYASYNEIPDNLLTFDFVYKSDFPIDLINYVSISSFNIVESVEYDAPTTIFGHLAEVLGDNLYGGIPNVDNVIFTIGGQDITLKSWLVTSTCIVLAVVLITILCLFIRWLFKLFSNTILLR